MQQQPYPFWGPSGLTLKLPYAPTRPRPRRSALFPLTCLNCSSKLQFCCEVKLFWTGLPLPPPPLCCEEGVGGCEGGRADEGDVEDVVTGGNASPPGGGGGGIYGEKEKNI